MKRPALHRICGTKAALPGDAVLLDRPDRRGDGFACAMEAVTRPDFDEGPQGDDLFRQAMLLWRERLTEATS